MDDAEITLAETESEQRYHWLRKNVADYHYHVRIENGEKLLKLYGSSCELTTGFLPDDHAADSKLWIKMVVADDRPIVEGQISSVLAGEVPQPIEFRIHRKDGQLRWLKKTIVPYYSTDKRLIAYDALLSDITDRKLAETALRESEKRFRLLFEDDLTGDYLAEPDGTIGESCTKSRNISKRFGIRLLMRLSRLINVALSSLQTEQPKKCLDTRQPNC